MVLRRPNFYDGPHLNSVFLNQKSPPQHVQVLDAQSRRFTPPQTAVGQHEDQRGVLAGSGQGMHLLVAEVDVRLLYLARETDAPGRILMVRRSLTASSRTAARTP